MPPLHMLLKTTTNVRPQIPSDLGRNPVVIRNLTFSFSSSQNEVPEGTEDDNAENILHNISLELPRGARCLLVGANGAGKSTLLRVLAGKRLTRKGGVYVLGQNAFWDAPKGVSYLGIEWSSNPIVHRDVTVSRLLESCGALLYPERCAQLLEIMDVNPNWRMHAISSGQRRRVQIVLGLLEPWEVLLLDEVTVDLDVLVRSDLLQFLKKETEERGAVVVYATHIFDGLGDWGTHVVHLSQGRVKHLRVMAPVKEAPANDQSNASQNDNTANNALQHTFPELHTALTNRNTHNSSLLTVIEGWLRDDLLEYRQQLRLQRSDSQSANNGTNTRSRDDKVHTKWDDMKEDMKTFGDWGYDYWKREEI